MLALCATIKAAGIAPWTYQGKYPEYMNDPLLMAWRPRPAATSCVKAIDNLRAQRLEDRGDQGRRRGDSRSSPPRATSWPAPRRCRTPSRRPPGARARPRSSRAARGWRPSRRRSRPKGFDMVMGAVPALDQLGQAAVPGRSRRPAASRSSCRRRPKNVAGGMEYLRILFSKQVGAKLRRDRRHAARGRRRDRRADAEQRPRLDPRRGQGRRQGGLHATASGPGTRRWRRRSTTPPASWSTSGQRRPVGDRIRRPPTPSPRTPPSRRHPLMRHGRLRFLVGALVARARAARRLRAVPVRAGVLAVAHRLDRRGRRGALRRGGQLHPPRRATRCSWTPCATTRLMLLCVPLVTIALGLFLASMLHLGGAAAARGTGGSGPTGSCTSSPSCCRWWSSRCCGSSSTTQQRPAQRRAAARSAWTASHAAGWPSRTWRCRR